MRKEFSVYWPIFGALVVYAGVYVSRINGDSDRVIITFLNRNVTGLAGDIFVFAIWLGMGPLIASLPLLAFVASSTSLLRTAIVLIGLSAALEPAINYVSNLRSLGDGLNFSTVVVNGLTIIVGGAMLLAAVVTVRFFLRQLKGAKENA